eukprot:m.214705 g.214705  ORF g.214705 m.214705 type:complete len:60 (+) comp39818_c0_seq8:342-521(+)
MRSKCGASLSDLFSQIGRNGKYSRPGSPQLAGEQQQQQNTSPSQHPSGQSSDQHSPPAS